MAKYFWLLMLIVVVGCSKPSLEAWSKEQALRAADQVEEVQALYGLEGGKWQSCIERKIVRSCDSDWVTCLEKGWVVQYKMSPKCGVVPDERFGVTIVIDGTTGRIISRFPEVEYFEDGKFCRDHSDCIKQAKAPVDESACFNFIHAAFHGPTSPQGCQCKNNICLPDK